MKNKLLNFLNSLPTSGYSRKVNEGGLQSPNIAKTTVFGILTICMLLCNVQDAFAQPANDACAAAIVIAVDAGDCADGVTNGDNIDATPDTEVGSCFAGGSNGVWFSFVAPASGFVDVTTDFTGGTSNDTEVAIFDGCGGAEIACDQDGGTVVNFNSVITGAEVTAGDTYFIQVSGWNGTEGTFCLAVNSADPPPAAPANDLCAGAIPLTVGGENVCTFSVGTNVSATDSGELPAPSCASYAGGDVWFTVTVPATGDTLTVDLGNAGGFTDSGMSIYSGTCGALTEIECDDDDSADGLFSMITLTGQTPGDILYIRVWEFGNNAFGEFNICATTDGVVAPAVCNGTVDFADSEACNVAGGTQAVLAPITCMAAPEIINADGTFTIIGFDIYVPDATGTYLGTVYESATFGVSACDPITIGIPDNFGCTALIYSFEVVTSINEFTADGTFISAVNDPECTSEVVTFTQYPVLTAVDVTADAAACGTLQVDLVAEDGTVCDTQTQMCVADGDVLNADFTATFVDPLGCSTLTATSAACAGCVVTPPTCEADTPEFEVDAGDCPGDASGDGFATPFTFMPSAGSTENTTAPFITEYIVTDGPGGNIVSVHLNLLDAENAANAQAAGVGGTACIAAINHNSEEFMVLSGEITGCVLATLPQENLTALFALVQAAAPGASLDIAGIELLIANGAGGTVDLSALGGDPLCSISPFCYAISTEVCITNVACDAAACAIAGDLTTAPAAPAVTESTCMMGGTVDCSTAPASVVYIASSDGTGDGSCTTAGEFIEICATAECTGCETGAGIDLTGWEVEDEASNDGSPETSINITSGTLLPGECVTIYSGYTTGDIASPATGTMGSAIGIASDRANCPLWNSGGDTAFLYDGDSQNGGALVDQEATVAGASTYAAPTVTCPTGGGGTGTLSGGSIAATTCPAGSTAEYSTDGGATWSSTVPTYNQTTSISVSARCLCDEDGTTASPASATVTTVPGICEPECPFIEAPTVTNITICEGDPDGALTALEATCAGCEDGTDAMITWWDHAAQQTGTGSVALGSGSPFDASGVIDASVAGMKFLYAQCECGECTSMRSQLMIVINSAISLDLDNITNPSCNSALSGPDGSFAVSAHGGAAPYTYTFDPDITAGAGLMTSDPLTTFEGLQAGDYNVTVTDANGCSDMGTVTLVEPEAFTVTTAFTPETCFGDETATVTITADNPGGLNIEFAISSENTWYPGTVGATSSTMTFTGLTSGTYTVFARDANNTSCIVSADLEVTGPEELSSPLVTGYMICVGEGIPAGEGLVAGCTNGSVTNAGTASAASTANGVAIPDNTDAFDACVTLDIAEAGMITDVNVSFTINHTWVSDLDVQLTSPSGTTVTLFGPNLACAGDDLDLAFDDEATSTYADLTGICNNAPAISGTFQSSDLLSAFDGEDLNGQWTLCAADFAGGDIGTIEDVSITIDFEEVMLASLANFYTQAGELVGTSSPFDPIATGVVNPNIPGTTCFLAGCYDELGCESDLVEVCLEIVDNPPAVTIEGPTSVCGSGTFTAVGGQEGSTFVWTVSGEGNVITSGTDDVATISFGATTDGPFTVSVTEFLGGPDGCSTTSTVSVIAETETSLSCKGGLNVSLGDDCGANLNPLIFLINPAYGADSYAVISAINADGEDVLESDTDAIVFESGQSYEVMIEHLCSGTRCWTSMFAEDKIAPTLDCPPTEQLGCTADNRPVWPDDYPTGRDNCCDLNSPDFYDYSDSNTIPAGSVVATGFSGVLAADRWALDLDVAGVIDFTSTTMNITSSSFQPTATDQIVGANYTAPFAMEICFDWLYNDEDGIWENFYINQNGVEVFATPDVALAESGNFCATLAADDVLTIGIFSEDSWEPASTAVISNISAVVTEDIVDNSACGNEFLLRTWSITDCNGNVGETCDQIVFITRPSLADIEFPDDITVECGTVGGTDPADLDGLVSDLDDEDDGLDEDYPVLEGEDLTEKTCFYVASYEDQYVENLCGNTVKIIRTWTVTDWCTAVQATDIQVIKLLDTTAPVILNCGGTVDVPAAAGSCDGFYGIPPVEIFEECANPVTVTANGLNIGDEVYIPEEGLTLTYLAVDACGNFSSCDVTLNLVDVFGPVAICDANTTVSLSDFDNGLAVICYPTFDDGSYDNCEDDIVIKVKRMDSADDFSNCVEFGCSDAESTVLVRMRVYDLYPDEFAVAQDAATQYPDVDPTSRYSECMIQVAVQDKIDAEISCQTRFIQCVDSYDDINDLGGTSFPNLSADPAAGVPVFCTTCSDISSETVLGYRSSSIFSVTDNCPNGLYLTISDNAQIGCGGTGRVFRRWRLYNASNVEIDNCTEQIRIENDFHCWNPSPDGSAGVNEVIDGVVVIHEDDAINWPSNATYDCNSGTAEQDVDALLAIMPDVQDLVEGLEDDCAELYLAVNDHYVYDLPNACYKVVREWKIFDDCKYDPNNPDDGGFWSATREITVIDSTAPTFDECADRVFDVTAPNCVEVDQVGCSGFADLSVNATDFCGNDAIVYRWFLDANADGLVDQIGEGNDASGVYPIGTHNIRYEAEDGCGNVAVCEFEFKIVDNKAPTPVCLVLTSTVMPSTGALEIWATDFESGSSCDNCTAYDNLEWRINKGTDRTTPPGANATSVTFDCTSEIISFGAPMDVQVWLMDEAGNWDFCITQIVFTPINPNDTDHPCFDGPEMLDIEGVVETEDHDMVEMVDVDVSSTSTNPFTTSNNGLFSFFGVPAGGNYVVTPEKDINPLNGVTTYDLVLISQHILGVQTLDSPYKIIAADANLSGTVTTLDLVKIRSVILNIDQDFAPNTSWRFVDMDFVFPNPTNPFATTFPEVIAYNNLTSDELATDFVGVKIGDVNGSALPNQLIGSQARNTNGTLIFNADDIKLVEGNEYTIDFTATDFTELLGYQYSIEFDNNTLEFVNIEAGELNDLTDANFGFSMLNEGIITTSWNSAKATTMEDNAVLFSLTFNAKSNGLLSDLLSATSKAVKAEAYSSDLDLFDVAIAFNTENGTVTSGPAFELLQNTPNPFKVETIVGFNLPKAQSATLQIMDVSGKLIKSIQGDFVRGYNEVKLNKQELQGAGVLYYQLDTATDTATKKMILIE